MNTMSITPLRRALLEKVRDGRVTYNQTEASWLIDGQPVGGWGGRTLAEMERAGYIARDNAQKLSTVDITDAGVQAL
jgi:hypothetical protein